MLLKVIRWDSKQNYHVCQDEEGNCRNIDLQVDGSLSEKNGPHFDDLVGREVSVVWTHPYIEIAHGVEVLPDATS